MSPHSSHTRFTKRLELIADELVESFDASVFRFVDPEFSSTADLFAGKGAHFANGRFPWEYYNNERNCRLA